MTIRFALVTAACARTIYTARSRLCPHYTAVYLSAFGRKFHSRQHVFKNNHQDNNEPLCPDHTNARLQTMPTNAVTCSLEPDTIRCVGVTPGWGTFLSSTPVLTFSIDVVFILSIYLFLFHWWSSFSNNVPVCYILRINSCRICISHFNESYNLLMNQCKFVIWFNQNCDSYTAGIDSEYAVHGRLWYDIILLHTKERSVRLLVAMNSKSMHDSKYTTQKSDVSRNGELIQLKANKFCGIWLQKGYIHVADSV